MRHSQRYPQSDQKILLPLLPTGQVHLYNELPACAISLLLLQHERWEACTVRLQHSISRWVIRESVLASILRQQCLPCDVWHNFFDNLMFSTSTGRGSTLKIVHWPEISILQFYPRSKIVSYILCTANQTGVHINRYFKADNLWIPKKRFVEGSP